MSLPAVLLLAPLPEFLLQPLRQVCTCHDYFHAADPAALLAEVGPEIRAIAMGGGSLALISLLQQLPALEILSVFGVGYDGVPLAYCQQRGLHVTNTPDVLTDDVADIAMALVLMTSRRLGEAERFARAGQWPQGSFP